MYYLITILFILQMGSLSAVDRVIIWGHKLYSHTHSYVHYGFYKAFKHLGYEVHWFDNDDDISQVELSNSLFITEHQVDQKMPLREDCYYAVHNSTNSKFDNIKKLNRYIYLKVHRTYELTGDSLQEVEPFIYYDIQNKSLIFPWATDLLPYEIEEQKKHVPLLLQKRKELQKVFWVGTIGGGEHGNIDELTPFIQACQENGIEFIHSCPWAHPVSFESNRDLIQQSYMAPTICGGIQLKYEYIPCRIFKNISYGQMGVTNSFTVYKLFKEKIVYNSDSHQLFYDAQNALDQCTPEQVYELMDFVKESHTYLNRAQHILRFLELLQSH